MHVMPLEERQRLGLRIEELHSIGQRRRDAGHVALHLVEQGTVVDDHSPVVVVELLPNDPYRHVGLPVQQGRALGLAGEGLDLLPLMLEPGHVPLDLLGADPFGGGTHDDPVPLGPDPIEDGP